MRAGEAEEISLLVLREGHLPTSSRHKLILRNQETSSPQYLSLPWSHLQSQPVPAPNPNPALHPRSSLAWARGGRDESLDRYLGGEDHSRASTDAEDGHMGLGGDKVQQLGHGLGVHVVLEDDAVDTGSTQKPTDLG